MFQNKKGLLLAGLAAYAIYRFSKMSPEEKNSLKEKGRKLVDEYLPENLKDVFGNKTSTTGENSGSFKPGF